MPELTAIYGIECSDWSLAIAFASVYNPQVYTTILQLCDMPENTKLDNESMKQILNFLNEDEDVWYDAYYELRFITNDIGLYCYTESEKLLHKKFIFGIRDEKLFTKIQENVVSNQNILSLFKFPKTGVCKSFEMFHDVVKEIFTSILKPSASTETAPKDDSDIDESDKVDEFSISPQVYFVLE